jgi:hypothetical protein
MAKVQNDLKEPPKPLLHRVVVKASGYYLHYEIVRSIFAAEFTRVNVLGLYEMPKWIQWKPTEKNQ